MANVATESQQLWPMSAKLRAAFEILLEAHSYAQDARKDIWQFAVEIDSLRSVGLLPNDFRWLVTRGYVEHAREATRPDDQQRTYQAQGKLAQTDRTCFILTDAGLALARSVRQSGSDPEKPANSPLGESENGRSQEPVPRWDQVRRELTVGGKMVKRYRLPSRNQEMVLTAFEEEGWPASIDDPLPPHPGQDPKHRLQATIKALNQHQKAHLVHFMGNGTGEGVLWEFVQQGGSQDSE